VAVVGGSPGRQDSPYGRLDVDPEAVVVRRNASHAASTARDVVSVSSPLRTMRATGRFESQAATMRGYLS
jgi:GTP cyclohydrolase I